MDRDVWVKITGVQISPDTKEPEEIEVITAGSYYWKNEKHYLRYEEITPDENGKTSNTVKISPDAVDILKKGNVNTHMLFQKDQKTVSYYNTPFGSLLIGLDTKEIDIAEEESSLTATVRYGLELNNHPIANCRIAISVNEKAAGELRI